MRGRPTSSQITPINQARKEEKQPEKVQLSKKNNR